MKTIYLGVIIKMCIDEWLVSNRYYNKHAKKYNLPAKAAGSNGCRAKNIIRSYFFPNYPRF